MNHAEQMAKFGTVVIYRAYIEKLRYTRRTMGVAGIEFKKIRAFAAICFRFLSTR
jgi:hypothetical protein